MRVSATLEQVECVHQDEGRLLDNTSEPYLWAAAFAMDGNQVMIVDPPIFTLHVPIPPLEVSVNAGNHGNLYPAGSSFPETGVTDGDILDVPPATGVLRIFTRPLELPPPCDPLLPRGVDGIVGVVAILLEHDSLDEEDAQRGHLAFNEALANELTTFIEGRSILAGGPTESEIDELARAVEARIAMAIQEGFDVDDIIDVLSGLDHSLGSKVWVFESAEIAQRRIGFDVELGTGTPNVWRMRGSIEAHDECLVNAVNRDRAKRGLELFDVTSLARIRSQLPPRTAQIVGDSLGAVAPGVIEVFHTRPDIEEQATPLVNEFLTFLSNEADRNEGPFPPELIARAAELAERIAAAAPPGEQDAILRWTALLPMASNQTLEALQATAASSPTLFTGKIKRFQDAG